MIKQYIIGILVCLSLVSYSQNSDTLVHDFPDKQAQYPSGMEAMYKHLYKYIKASKSDSLTVADYPSKVFLEFIVDTSGQADSVKVLRDKYNLIKPSMLEAIKAMPQWTPAEHQGKKVKQRFRLPVNIHYE